MNSSFNLSKLFAKHLKSTYKVLFIRNKERLSLCDEKTLELVRAELLDNEYRLLFSKSGTKKYSLELFEEYNNQLKKYTKANFSQKLQFAKEKMVEFGMSERDRIIEWTNRPNEELVKDMAEYAAWLAVMKYRIDEADVLFEEDELYDFVLHNEKPNTNGVKIKDNQQTIDSEKPNTKKPTKRRRSYKSSSSKMQINVDYLELLPILYNKLDKNYIEHISISSFNDAFDGKTSSGYINWIATDYEFVYLLDNLEFMLDKRLYRINGSAKLKELQRHFKLKGRNLNSGSLRGTRNKIKELQSLSKTEYEKCTNEMKKNITALDIVIQELKNRIEK
jgi:hypothetical protein